MLRRILGALLVAALLLPQIASTSGQTGQTVTRRYQNVSVGGNINVVAVQGSLAYVGEGSKFTIIDTGNPAAPQRLGSVALSGPVVAVKVAGTRAYALTQITDYRTDPRNQMVIIDVRNPAAPYIISSTRLGKGGRGLDVVGNLVYVGRGTCCFAGEEDAGLVVFDTTNVLSPTVYTSFSINSGITDLDVVGTRVYLTSHTSFTILDASVSPPTVVGDYYVGNTALDMVVSGDYAYITTQSSTQTLVVLDLREEDNIKLADSLDMSLIPVYISVENNRLYLAGGMYSFLYNEIRVMDISNPYDILQIGRAAGGQGTSDVVVVNKIAYLADKYGGLRLFDATDPAAISALGSSELVSTPQELWGDGNLAYVSEESAPPVTRISIIDHSAPTPLRVGSIIEQPLAIQVIDDTMYLLTREGLRIADVSDPAQPTWLSAMPLNSSSLMDIQGDFAYIMGNPTLSVIDISQPLTPTLRAQYTDPKPEPNNELRVEGGKAYISRGFKGMIILDIQNLDAIAQVGYYAGITRHFAVDGTMVYSLRMPYSNYGIDLIDMSNPAAPKVVSAYTLNEAGRAIVVDQGVAYVATSTFDSAGEIHILDVSDPAQLRLKERIATNGAPTDLQMAGNRLYVNEGSNGFRVIDVTPQADPQRVFLPLVRR